ncbi:unnamed protein product, partial [marine sediment metagenome]
SYIPLYKLIQRATFPGVQGTPYFNHIAAKAVFFRETLSDEYKARQFKIVENAKTLANNLLNLGYNVLAGGTDNHMILVNVANLRKHLTGVIAQKCLEDCGIVVDMYKLPYDNREASVTSGIRLGTPIVTKRVMGTDQMQAIAAMIDAVLRAVKIINDTEYEIDESLKRQTRNKVKDLCSKFPVR